MKKKKEVAVWKKKTTNKQKPKQTKTKQKNKTSGAYWKNSYLLISKHIPEGDSFRNKVAGRQHFLALPPCPNINTQPHAGTSTMSTLPNSLTPRPPSPLHFGRSTLFSHIYLSLGSVHTLPRKTSKTLPTPHILTSVFYRALVSVAAAVGGPCGAWGVPC